MKLPLQAIESPLRLVAVLLLVGACGSNSDTPAKTPTDSDSTAEELETDTPTDGVTACLETISGRVVVEGADPIPVSVIVCIGVCFAPISTDIDGGFEWRHPIGGDFDCIPYNFEDTPLHINLRVTEAPDTFAEYSFIKVPTQEEISDLGDDDFDLNLGNLSVYALPTPAAAYSPSDGASISQSGLTADFPASSLVKFDGDGEVPVDHNQDIFVFKAPLDQWTPPFADADIRVLFFLGPRWARLAGAGVPIAIEAPPDFEDGDPATVYLLGSFSSEWGSEAVSDEPDFMYVDAEGRCINDNGADDLTMVDDGEFQNCGQVTVENGIITTPPVPRLTWVGIGK